jgi:cytoskeletal protein CcmA (bactofilin family)
MSFLRAVKSLWAPTPAPARPTVKDVVFVHEGAEMHGVLQAKAGSTVMVQGTQRGDITGARVVFVASSGVVDGSVYADEVIVAGEVIGEVHASRRAEVHSSGVVIGTILTKAALFLKGARVNGSLRIGSNVNVEVGTNSSTLGAQMNVLSRPSVHVPGVAVPSVSSPSISMPATASTHVSLPGVPIPSAPRLEPLEMPAASAPQAIPTVQSINGSEESEVVVQKVYRISLSLDGPASEG